ncbi:MAG TPA: alpha/beta fold hydrolase, partial [Ilumatobacteraceae bacterium]
MNLTDTTPSSSVPTNRRPRTLHRSLGVAALGAALISIAACGADTATDAARTSAPAPATTSVPASAPTSAPPVTSAPTAAPTSVPLAASTSTTSPTVAALAAPRPTAMVDELVDVDGVRVHVRCVGSGDTTVLLISGFEIGDENWGKVEPDIATRARVCSYARPGTGTSDPATSTQTFTTQAAQLSALLTTIGEPGPYVVVGHSFGGSEAITFASRYADQVTGLVLIDASPATWPAELCAVTDDGSGMAALIDANCAGWTDPTANAEHLDVFGSFGEVAGITELGALPMTVITAVERQFADLGASELARLTAAWNQGQQRWA